MKSMPLKFVKEWHTWEAGDVARVDGELAREALREGVAMRVAIRPEPRQTRAVRLGSRYEREDETCE